MRLHGRVQLYAVGRCVHARCTPAPRPPWLLACPRRRAPTTWGSASSWWSTCSSWRAARGCARTRTIAGCSTIVGFFDAMGATELWLLSAAPLSTSTGRSICRNQTIHLPNRPPLQWRVSFISGDVHLAAVGRLYSFPPLPDTHTLTYPTRTQPIHPPILPVARVLHIRRRPPGGRRPPVQLPQDHLARERPGLHAAVCVLRHRQRAAARPARKGAPGGRGPRCLQRCLQRRILKPAMLVCVVRHRRRAAAILARKGAAAGVLSSRRGALAVTMPAVQCSERNRVCRSLPGARRAGLPPNVHGRTPHAARRF